MDLISPSFSDHLGASMRDGFLIKQNTDYAMRALIHLRLAGVEKQTAAELAEACSIPPSVAQKVLTKLSHANFLDSQVGRDGGFRLRADPGKITLKKIVIAMQGPALVRRCVLNPGGCPLSENCPVSGEWRRVQNAIAGFLNDVSLDDLVRNLAETENAD